MASLGGIVLYPDFAEVRQEVELPAGEWVWQPEAGILNSILPGTLYLAGVAETSRHIQPGDFDLRAYQGRQVRLELSEGEFVTAAVVDADRRIFRLETGDYLAGFDGRILFPSEAGLRPDQVTFKYQGQGQGELSYLTSALRFDIRYTLDAQSGELVAWSGIDNQTGQELSFSEAEYIAGQVPTDSGVYPVARYEAALAGDAMPKFAGSGGGVYRYTHEGELTLLPGRNEFPFLRSAVEPVYTWTYQSSFEPALQEIFFGRSYRFDAPGPMAGGSVSVRDQGRFVGQGRAGTTAPGEEVEIGLGADPEGRAQRRVEVLVDTPAEKRYRVITSVKNSRTEPVALILAEDFYADAVEIEFPGATRTANGYRLETEIPAGAEQELSYTVTLRFRNPN